ALARRLLELGLHRAGGRGELDDERDAPAVDHEILHEAEIEDALPEVGIDDGAQRVEDAFLAERAHEGLRSAARERGARRRRALMAASLDTRSASVTRESTDRTA